MATDEELLIRAAKTKRRNHRSGRNLLLALVVAAIFAVIGWVLIFQVRAFLRAIPFLPLGTVTSWLLFIGGAAFVVAGLVVVAALLVANPRKAWGAPVVGACPTCGNRTLRQDTVVSTGSDAAGNPRLGAKGVVTLCETKGCDYASATVTTPSPAG